MLPTPLEMVRALVSERSISSTVPALDTSNRAVLAHLAQWAEDAGMQVRWLDVPEAPGKANLLCTLGHGEGGLVLAGHSDTVPFDENAWQSDPFKPETRDDRLYGLGATDMKGFLALALEAIRQVEEGQLTSPVMLLATADEETTMSGARALAASGQLPGRFAVVGEPTDLQPVRMHKGVLMESVQIVGRTGHSSKPHLGLNAIDGMHTVLKVLSAYRDELAKTHVVRDAGGLSLEVPYPTVNFGRIQGGDAANRICGACELSFDVRLVPGMTLDGTRAAFRTRIEEALAGTGLTVQFGEEFGGVEPFVNDADSPLVRAVEELTDTPARAVTYGTEGPLYAAAGLDTLIWGPGSIDVAHQPNEYLPLAQMVPTVDGLTRLIQRFCTG